MIALGWTYPIPMENPKYQIDFSHDRCTYSACAVYLQM